MLGPQVIILDHFWYSKTLHFEPPVPWPLKTTKKHRVPARQHDPQRPTSQKPATKHVTAIMYFVLRALYFVLGGSAA